MYGAVYLATNQVNGKRYVGQTTLPVEARWAAHVRGRFAARCRLLSRAIRKHGREAFTVEGIATCATREELNASERFAIEWLGTVAPSGYNLTTGGESAYRRSDDTRKRISAAWTPEKRRAWSEKQGAESSARFARARSLSLAARRIPLAVIAPDGTRQTFGSCQEACAALGLEASAVSQCLNRKARHKRHKGYSFERIAKET